MVLLALAVPLQADSAPEARSLIELAKGDLARLHRDRYACFESLQTVARQFRQSQTRS